MFSGWTEGTRPASWWEGFLVLLMALSASLLLLVGIFGNARMVEKTADWSTRHEASIVVIIMAAPIYWLLKTVTRKR